MDNLVATFRKDIQFELDFDIPYVPDFAGYILQDMLVRIKGWYDPDNYSNPDNNELYGILIDIENGQERMSSNAKMNLEEIFMSQESKDQKEKEYFEKYFEEKGQPFQRESFGSFRKGMYLLMIPTKNNIGDEGVTPDDIKNEQIEIIKTYINEMRDEWKNLWEHVNNLNKEYRSEFDDYHKKLTSDEPHGRFELYRSFVTNTINGKNTDVFQFKSLLEWLIDKQNILEDETGISTTINKLCVPFMEGATYKVQTDWTIPYIMFYPWHARGQLRNSKTSPDSPDYYYPFHTFLSDFTNTDTVKIHADYTNPTIKLKPTGFTLLSIAAQMITNLNYLTAQNSKALDGYSGYVFKLDIIKQLLLGRDPLNLKKDPFKKGPFKDFSSAEIDDLIKQAESSYGKSNWEADMKNDFGYDEFVNDESNPKHKQQLLLGINDIQKLQRFFRSVIHKESTEYGGVNNDRINAINHAYIQLNKLIQLPDWVEAMEDLWMWNTDNYGPMLFVSMAELLLAQSSLGDDIYKNNHKKLIFDSELLDQPREEWQNKEWAASGGSHITSNWYIAFPGVISTIFQAQYQRYAEEVINTAGDNFIEASKQLKKPFRKILRHFIPSLENNFSNLDVEIDNLSRRIQNLDGIQELRTGVLLDPVKTNLDRLVRQTINQTMVDINQQMETMQGLAKGQTICSGLSVLLNMYSLVSFGVYKGISGEEGDISNWNSTEFSGLGIQLVALTDDVLSFSSATGVLKVINGTKLASTLSIISKTAAWLGVIQSSIQCVSSYANEDWKNLGLSSASVVGGLMMIGGGFIKLGAGTSATGIGAPVGLLLIKIGFVITALAGIFQFFSILENKAEKFCRHILISDRNDGGMDKFQHYKYDFDYNASYSSRGLMYDKSEFGSNINKIDDLVERVINFINDYDTYSLYDI